MVSGEIFVNEGTTESNSGADLQALGARERKTRSEKFGGKLENH